MPSLDWPVRPFKQKRFIAISVPHSSDCGASWFAYDRLERKSYPCEDADAASDVARNMNYAKEIRHGKEETAAGQALGTPG